MSDDVEPEGRVLFGERLVDFLRLWGVMEHTIDQCIAMIYRLHGGRSLVPANAKTTERKIGALRIFARLPTVAPYASLIEDIAGILMEEKKARNHIVHGTPIKIESDGTAHIVLLRPNFDRPEHILRVVGDKEWERLTEVCLRVHIQGMTLLFGLMPEDMRSSEIEYADRRDWFIRGVDGLPASKKVRNLYKELWPESVKD